MPRTRLLAPVLATATVLAAGVAMFATRGLLDAVMMIAVVVALAGAYLLRHYARATLIYRRPALTTADHAPAAPDGRTRDRGPEGAGPSAPEGVAKPRAPLVPGAK